jgi:3-hydroxyisobutyrate dehydrogenase-like beta-hydroxyacid dehydrogenase
MTDKSVGFIGLGSMGYPMAKRLCESGYQLITTVNRNIEPAEKLKELGAVVKDSPIDVIKASEIIITMLPEDAQVEEVLLHSESLEAFKPGAILLEMTSGSPQFIKKVEKELEIYKVSVLDAPVSGGTIGAENGTLTIMIGGKQEIIDQVKPILEVMGKNIIHVGEIGSGNGIKAINQMLAAVNMLATSEAIALAEEIGMDLSSLYDVIKESSGNSWMFTNKFESIVNRQFDLGFRLKLMTKDIKIAISEGENVSLPLASNAYQLYKVASRKDGEIDFAAISKVIRG